MERIVQRSDHVFVNCPFDEQYKPLFDAIIFTIIDCGFRPRCALEVDDSSETRIDKIQRLIQECRIGIHDISRTELNENELPRFNMPLELGLFLGAKRFGVRSQKQKVCVIMDRDRYRFQQFISDIGGQDIKAHNGDAYRCISIVRDVLRNLKPEFVLPGGKKIQAKYALFEKTLPSVCEELGLEQQDLTFADYLHTISIWAQDIDLRGELV